MTGVLFALPAQAADTTPFAQKKPLALRGATTDREEVPRCGKLELTLDLAATYDNPFDPEDIDVEAIFTTPQGSIRQVSGFLYQPFTRKLENNEEKIEPAGEPVWKVRFAPDTVGAWKYRIEVRDRTGRVSLPEKSFTVVASNSPGFIRRSRNNPAVFATEGEKPFFAVGLNVCWGGKRGSFDYDDWLPPLGKAGGNWIRIWMCSWNCALEWAREAKGENRSGTYYGIGVYSLDNAWKLDTILDTAEKNGLATMLCLGTYGEFTEGGYFGEGQWKANPYNAANGGPCQKPEEFWTNAQARKLYRRRLRYLIARYGYRTSLHSWEFWNEANPPAAWVGEMAGYLKGTGVFQNLGPADAFHHLVTTTYGSEPIWKLSEIDFTQSHHYGTGEVADHAPVIYNDARQHAVYGKPHLMGEFGIDWRKSDFDYDRGGLGINFHNGLWASAFAGNAGGGMLWWWDNYIHPLNLYAPFRAFRTFTEKIPWTEGAWRPMLTDAPRITKGAETFTDLTVPATSGWGKSAATDFTLTPGGVQGSQPFPQFLYSPAKADLRTTPTLHVNYSQPGQFRMRVNTVSDKAQFRILLDGKLARELTLSATPPEDKSATPEYEKTEFKKEYGIYQAVFNKEYGIDVPAGMHTIRLENAKGDWASLESVTLTGYRSSRYPSLNLYALTNGKEAILWAQNARHNWKNVAEKRPIPEIKDAEAVVRGLPAGRYTVEWWDTTSGVVKRRDSVNALANGLSLSLPDLPTDIAARIMPVKN